MTSYIPILIIDDEEHILNSLSLIIKAHGFQNVIKCNSSLKADEIIQTRTPGVILLDITMPEKTGLELLAECAEKYPDIPVIMITGLYEVKTAVDCMKNGAFDYIPKPPDIPVLIASIKRALEVSELRKENTLLKQTFRSNELSNPKAFTKIITLNKDIKKILQYCEAVALSSKPVLVTGETGTGKELIAQSIYKAKQCSGEFITVNVAGLSEQLFDDTLYGHVKGAFTGADLNRQGMIEKAENGVLFLDEIGDLSFSSQIKLLRTIQEREFSPLGSDAVKQTNAKIIVATNIDIIELKNEKNFRKDLFYRLSTHHIHLPPLRERFDDLSLLFDAFLKMSSVDQSKDIPKYNLDILRLLKTYSFPGNIRELKAMIDDALARCTSDSLSIDVFKKHIGFLKENMNHNNWIESIEVIPTLKEASLLLIKESLKRSNDNQSIAAKMLGISRQALNQRLKKQ